ncbi:hypothetical protein B296_00020445 [Ensete ventricosum]|uniref:Protein-L-isoaspartate O-methyltransferase n=1 Tax=Ensete ventricosum TaxID=4639 RepID=A0A427A8D9_ENSVE|nr:hypothetical protein B296_00020445 [Ensete ventricosum]
MQQYLHLTCMQLVSNYWKNIYNLECMPWMLVQVYTLPRRCGIKLTPACDFETGTGYLTACFAIMVGPQGCAVGVEHIPELVASSINSIKRSAASLMLDEGSLSVHAAGTSTSLHIYRVKLLEGLGSFFFLHDLCSSVIAVDGRKGWPELAPYDAIHVGAASPDIPRSLLAQLKPGGRMVIPVGNFFQDLKVVDKNDDGSVRVRSEASVRFVPLTSRAAQLHDY